MRPRAGRGWEQPFQSQPEKPQYQQYNHASRNGKIYAAQGDLNVYGQNRGIAGRLLVVLLAFDVVFFFYGMTAYTGRSTDTDSWRAGIFFVLIAMTGAAFRGWFRRRL